MEKIRLLHTNDIHSHLEKWPKIRRFLQERQQTTVNESTFTVDLGDFCDRWHPLTEATEGKANTQLMNQVHYDAVTIGNNEGIGNSKNQLNQLYKEAEFPVILANLFDKSTLQLPEWADEHKIITTKEGTRIGLIGATAPFPLTYTPNGWDVRSWSEILPNIVRFLRKKVDILVLLSHLGINDDRQIAKDLPEFDVIIGSHTHHLFANGEQVGNTLLVAAGRFGEYVGEVTLLLDDDHQLNKTRADTFATSEMISYPEDEAEIFRYTDEGKKLLQEKKVAWLPFNLEVDQQEHSLVDETLTAVKERGETEVAILNTGLFLDDLKEGIVNQNKLHMILPHPMHLIRVTLKGSDVTRLIMEMEKNRYFLRNYPIRGMGFRGKIFGQIVYSGIQYDATNHVVKWLNQTIDPRKFYSFTTVDHFMFIPFFPTIEIAGKVEFLFPEFIRTVLGDYLAKKYPLSLENKV